MVFALTCTVNVLKHTSILAQRKSNTVSLFAMSHLVGKRGRLYTTIVHDHLAIASRYFPSPVVVGVCNTVCNTVCRESITTMTLVACRKRRLKEGWVLLVVHALGSVVLSDCYLKMLADL